MDIVLDLQGGLGNVLFQVAFGLLAARRWGGRLSIGRTDFHHMTSAESFGFLQGLEKVRAAPAGALKWIPGDVEVGKTPEEVLEGAEAVFARAAAERAPAVSIVDGYFQSERYWAALAGAEAGPRFVRERFAPPAEVAGRLAAFYGADRLARGYFVHVRRGDYLGSGFDMKLTRRGGYFARALAAASAGDGWRADRGAVCFFFTDDARYDAAAFAEDTGTALGGDAGGGSDVVVVRGLSETLALWLMSMCRLGGVCSNSTFSWWGGWLNENAEKRVYFPAEWHYAKYAYAGMRAIPAGADAESLSVHKIE